MRLAEFGSVGQKEISPTIREIREIREIRDINARS
jgi:hypothetical protein